MSDSAWGKVCRMDVSFSLRLFTLVSFFLLLGVTRGWSSEPTLGRFAFWVPSERMAAFEAEYAEKVAPILKRHGLTPSSARVYSAR